MTNRTQSQKNIEKQIPEGWVETTLGEVVFPVSQTFDFEGKEKVHFLNTGDILDGKLLHFNLSDVSTLPGQAKKSFKQKDILYSEIRPANKRYMLVDFDSSNSVASTKLMVLRGKENIDIDFIYKLITANNTLQEFQVIAESRSGTFPQITFESVSNFPILLPLFPEQQAIASVLSVFDDKIELLREQNKTLEEMGQTLFKEWFGKYSVDRSQELPVGWRVGKLGEVGKQITERVKNQENRQVLSAVNTGNLVLSEDYFTKQVFSKTLEKYIICEPGDFAYNPARINIGSIGRNKNVFGAVSPVYVVFRPIEKMGRYLEFIFKSKDFNRHVEKFANGSVRQALNYDGFSRFEILIPNDEILKEFNKIILDFDNKANFNNSQIQSLARGRDELLPKLMSGEVRVK